jgi:epoxyqueuosine reductase
VNPVLDWLAEMSAQQFSDTFRGSPVRRAKQVGLRRNAAIAMGNSGREEFVPLLEKMSGDSDQHVSEAAAWALGRLKPTS